MNYRERLERKADRLESWAESRERKAAAARAVIEQITEAIPMGQPVLLGHHSQKGHEKALERRWNKVGEAVEHSDKAEAFRRRAEGNRKHAERIVEAIEASAEDYQPGDRVIARFTNSYRIYTFEGEIVDRTLNFWKVRTITAPYPNEEPGRVMHIPCKGRKGYSANNGIVGRA